LEISVSELKDPRVLFAAERTLLGWTRTSLALITIGFLVERSAFLIGAFAPQYATAGATGTIFWLGLAFIALGAFSALFASRQYLVALRSLSSDEYPPGYNARWSIAVNIIVAILGILLAVAVFASSAS
jgi:putative membrane protein